MEPNIEHHFTDEHLMACLFGTAMAEGLAKSLPDGDLADELKTLLGAQFDILETFIQGKHYGTRQINAHMDYLNGVRNQLMEIRKCP